MQQQGNNVAPTAIKHSSEEERGHGKSVQAGVILVHGLTGNPSEMRPIGKYLEKKGFCVKAPLLAGHGGEHKALMDSTWQDWLESVKTAIHDLDQELNGDAKGATTPIFLVGLSMGSLLSALSSIDDTRIKGVVMLSTTLGFPGKDIPITRHLLPIVTRLPFLFRILYWTEKEPYGLKDQRLQRMIKRSIEASKRGESKDFGLFRTYLASLYQFQELKKAFYKGAPQVETPCVMIHSEEDTIASVENAFSAYSAISSTQKSVELITGCDHVMTVDLQKLDVAARVERFILTQLQQREVQIQQPRVNAAWDVA